MSLDIMPKMPHANIGINRVYTQVRNVPTLNINAIWPESIKSYLNTVSDYVRYEEVNMPCCPKKIKFFLNLSNS